MAQQPASVYQIFLKDSEEVFFQSKTLLQNFSLMKKFLTTAVFGSTAYMKMTYFFN